MPEIIVFLGPSLTQDEARSILDATYRPPVARGDVEAAVASGARIICLIDGVFFQECAVAHREILAALKAGVRVIGASSMGALRGAELDSLGMEGVGEVYRMYRDRVLESDDEVALVFDPESGRPLSEPLVNIRATLARAEEKEILNRKEHTLLLEIAQRLYYPERTYERICEEAEGKIAGIVLVRFLQFVQTEAVDVKRKDAILALEYIRRIVQEERKPC
jgi:hypothetical protein